MRLLKLLVPVFLSIILIVFDTRFSYLDNFKKFTLTLLSPIYVIVDLPSQVIGWVNDKGADNDKLISENDSENLSGHLSASPLTNNYLVK